MPDYDFDGTRVRRKHLFLPCVIHADLDSMSEEEQAAAYKAAYYLDYVTEAEWKVVLRRDGATKNNRSRLKRKLVGWLVALGHIIRVNPEVWEQARLGAIDLYREQFKDEHPLFSPERHIRFYVEGDGYSMRSGDSRVMAVLPDGRDVLLMCEISAVVSAEILD